MTTVNHRSALQGDAAAHLPPAGQAQEALRGTIHALPGELIEYILAQLDTHSLAKAMCVCRLWKTASVVAWKAPISESIEAEFPRHRVVGQLFWNSMKRMMSAHPESIEKFEGETIGALFARKSHSFQLQADAPEFPAQAKALRAQAATLREQIAEIETLNAQATDLAVLSGRHEGAQPDAYLEQSASIWEAIFALRDAAGGDEFELRRKAFSLETQAGMPQRKANGYKLLCDGVWLKDHIRQCYQVMRPVEVEGNAGFGMFLKPADLDLGILIDIFAALGIPGEQCPGFAYIDANMILEALRDVSSGPVTLSALTNGLIAKTRGIPLSACEEMVAALHCETPKLLDLSGYITITQFILETPRLYGQDNPTFSLIQEGGVSGWGRLAVGSTPEDEGLRVIDHFSLHQRGSGGQLTCKPKGA